VTSSFRLGRIAGVEIGVNWSWLIIFALVAFSLAARIFPDQNPGLSDETYVVMALVAATLFFCSILAHELGHAIQAIRDGMEIDGITLWLFGGVAKFKGQFPSAGAEFRIAVGGPLVSLAIGISFVVLGVLLPLPAAVDGVVMWLGYINLILLVFNLLPALPLDGGRMLRAALWYFRSDFRSATRVAAGLGRVFGQLLIAGGLALLLFAGAFGGIWLAFIGFFLLSAADQEGQVAEARDALQDLRVADVMVSDPVTVTPELSVHDFVESVFLSHRHASYPVVEDGRAVGLASARRLAGLPREEWARRRVGEAMVRVEDVLVLTVDRPLSEALSELAQSELGRALVCSGDRLEGLVSITDVARVIEIRGTGRGGQLSRPEPLGSARAEAAPRAGPEAAARRPVRAVSPLPAVGPAAPPPRPPRWARRSGRR